MSTQPFPLPQVDPNSPLGQAPPMQPGVLPPPSPVQQPQAGGMQDYANLAAQQQQQLLTSGPAQEAAQARQQVQSLAGQAAAQPLPKTGPEIDRSRGFLYNLGQALLMAGQITGPGQALVQGIYGPGERRYAGQQAQYAEQIKAAQERATGAEREVGTLGTVAGRTIMGGGRVEAAQISAEEMSKRTQTLAQQIVQRHQDNLARIAAMTNINERNNAAKIEAQKMKDETSIATTGMKDLSQQQIRQMADDTAQAIVNTKPFVESPIKMYLMEGLLGMPVPQAPGGASPTMTPLGTGKGKAAAPSGGGHKVGDKVTIKGKQMTITKVYPNGRFDAN